MKSSFTYIFLERILSEKRENNGNIWSPRKKGEKKARLRRLPSVVPMTGAFALSSSASFSVILHSEIVHLATQ